MLQGIFPFSNLDQKTLRQLVPYIEKGTFTSGVQLFSQEQESNALYFILVGRVEITREDKKGKRVLGNLKAGDHFGEDSPPNFHRF